MAAARIVLVHGTRVSHTQWDGYRELLPDLDVVTPDLPGHGPRVDEAFSTGAATAVIEEAVEGGEPGLPVVLVGHSLGGYMSMAYAARHPARLDGLVLIGSSGVPHGLGAAAYRGFAALIDRLGHERMARLSNAVLTRLSDPATVETVLAGGDSYAATATAWEAVMGDCGPQMLRQVSCPVLLLNGQFDQLGVHAGRFLAECRDGRAVRVPRATHLLPVTHKDVVAGIVAEFTAEVSGSGRATGGGLRQ
jgi:pimeloyl-ACP methyl ester carboxylesterase